MNKSQITTLPVLTLSGRTRWHFVTPSVRGGTTKSLHTWATKAAALRAGRREWASEGAIEVEVERRVAALGVRFSKGEIDLEAYGEARRKIDAWALAMQEARGRTAMDLIEQGLITHGEQE